jgi:hypothetical protein
VTVPLPTTPTGPWLSTVYHPRACNRYYGLMRQSDELPTVYGLSHRVFARDRAVRLTFPSLLRHTLCIHAVTLTPPTDPVHLMVHPGVLRAFTFFCQVRLIGYPQTGFSGVRLTRRQFSLNVTACMLARAPDQSPPFNDGHARLQQSLPRPESPPARVCYDYSAQPPIAEAGFSPARVSKNKGCTRS